MIYVLKNLQHKVFKAPILILLVFTASFSYADATDGELFGYKIGDRYPLTEETASKLLFNKLTILAENPVSPDDISSVYLGATVKSHTITEISTIDEFDNNEDALLFAHKYARILRSKYGKYEVKSIFSTLKLKSALPSVILDLKFEETHDLSVMFISGYPDENPMIRIILSSNKYRDLADKEFDTMVSDETKTNKSLQGL